MKKKTYILENLDCANCAAKIEAKMNALPQVEQATIIFATMQLQLTAEDPDALIPKLTEIGRSVEPDFEIHDRKEQAHHHHDHCHEQEHGHCECGHCHEHGHEHRHEHQHHHEAGDRDLRDILVGAGLFIVGLVLEWMDLEIIAAIGFVAAYLVLGREVLMTAGKNLVKGHIFDENFLMGIATLGAFAIGEFPEAVGVMLFYRIGEFFEEKAVSRSRSQIMEAVDLRPEVVHLVSGTEISAEDAKVGDLLTVRPGDRIPLDGTVVEGTSRIDTAPITGEPVPVSVRPGDSVTSGCVNTDGLLTVRVEKPLSESMVSRILSSVENAAANKPKMDRFITRFARVYTPIVVALAAAVAIIPSIITGEWKYWIYTALSFLVMSCPCALVLSVPLAFFSGIGVGSKKGILFKGGASIEALAEVKAVVMDKTGTLTRGDFTLQHAEGGDEILALCAGCEQHSTHPIAQSILTAAKEKGLTLPAPQQVEEIPGHGIRAVVDGCQVHCGNEKLMEKFGIRAESAPSGSGTAVLVAKEGVLIGRLTIADTLKPGAAEAVTRLKTMDITTAMLTGDGESTARAVADQTGIDNFYAKLLPDEKLEKLRHLRSQSGPTMFVGDGINDAPVLAGADVGAAMGSGADAAIEAADVVFLTSGTDAIPESITIARRTKGVAWQNVIFALAVKLIVMLLGLTGYASMWAAVFADSGVAMLCVLNAVRMLYQKRR